MSTQPPDVDALLHDWRDWPLALTGRPQVAAVVPGGRTNTSLRLVARGLEHDLLLRVHHPQSARLGIDREREREIVSATAGAGIGRPYLHWDRAHRFAIFPWLDGRAWTADDFADAGQRNRLWPLLERLRAMPLAQPRRRYTDYLDAYWNRLDPADRAAKTLRLAWQDFRPRLRDFDDAPWPACLVHHDLVPANVLECGGRPVLIDWEYAAPGHPDIDRYRLDPGLVGEPFVAELMNWIDRLWERLVRAPAGGAAPDRNRRNRDTSF
jgi:thiamine kinase-like enzyme